MRGSGDSGLKLGHGAQWGRGTRFALGGSRLASVSRQRGRDKSSRGANLLHGHKDFVFLDELGAGIALRPEEAEPPVRLGIDRCRSDAVARFIHHNAQILILLNGRGDRGLTLDRLTIDGDIGAFWLSIDSNLLGTVAGAQAKHNKSSKKMQATLLHAQQCTPARQQEQEKTEPQSKGTQQIREFESCARA